MRTSLHRRRAVVSAMVAGLLIVASCGDDGASDGTSSAATTETGSAAGTTASTPGDNTPTTGGEITIAQALNPSSLDPITGGSGGDIIPLFTMFDRLINFDPETLEPLPGLATAWDYPDPQTLVLTLQEGVTFHDGTAFDAEAAKYNLDRALSLDTSSVKADLSMIESVEATAPNELTIHFNRPDASLLLMLAERPGMMVSPTAAETAGDDFRRNPVGTGPFTFVEFLPNDRLVVKKNPDYWQEGKPYLDQITFRFIADQQTLNNALTAREVDMGLRLNPAVADTLEQNDNLTVVSRPSLVLDMCYFNFSRPPFDDVNARLAVQYALDRESLNQTYAFGRALPASSLYPPGYWAADPELADTFYHDVDRAKELLAQAGYRDGMSIKGLGYDGPGQARKLEIIQAQLKEAGIDMAFDIMEVGAATLTFVEDLTHDLYCAGTSGRPDPSQTANAFLSDDAFYKAGDYASPGMEEALAAAGTSQDQAERSAAFSEVIRLMQEDSLMAVTLHMPSINAMYGNVAGFVPNLYGQVDVSFMWLEE